MSLTHRVALLPHTIRHGGTLAEYLDSSEGTPCQRIISCERPLPPDTRCLGIMSMRMDWRLSYVRSPAKSSGWLAHPRMLPAAWKTCLPSLIGTLSTRPPQITIMRVCYYAPGTVCESSDCVWYSQRTNMLQLHEAWDCALCGHGRKLYHPRPALLQHHNHPLDRLCNHPLFNS